MKPLNDASMEETLGHISSFSNFTETNVLSPTEYFKWDSTQESMDFYHRGIVDEVTGLCLKSHPGPHWI